jgi:hypothetical protein
MLYSVILCQIVPSVYFKNSSIFNIFEMLYIISFVIFFQSESSSGLIIVNSNSNIVQVFKLAEMKKML